VIVVRDNDRVHRALLEQHGARAIAEGAHFVAYTMPR